MSKSRYKLGRLAQAHLRKIKAYTIENFSEWQWQNYQKALQSGFQMLADNPELGRGCDIYSGGSYFPIGKHAVYFTKENGFILIVAVLGQSQLPQNHLR